MAKREDSHSDMAHARQSDGINVIFDEKSPASTRSRSRSSSSCDSRRSHGSGRSHGSDHYRGRGYNRGRYRSSSSSSSSRSSSRGRSRSHPRCHRPFSRCRCENHHRYGRGRRSPPRRYRARSRSFSRTPSPDRYSRNRRYRSRSRSSSRWSRYRRASSRVSPLKTYRSDSRSGPSEHSINLTLDDKRELLKAAVANAATILGVEKLKLPESVKPILSEESKQVLPETWVRQEDPEKTPSQSSEVEPDDMSSPKMSPKRKIISFSINNSVVKPSVAAPSSAKVTSRMDSYESRKPYGHWVRVKSGQSNARKHTLATSQ